MRRIQSALLVILAVLTVHVSPVQAQSERTFSVIGEFGYLFSVRSIGKNSGELQQLDFLQVISDFNDVPTASAGVAVGFPAQEVTIRAIFETTLGGSAVGRVAFCGNPDNPLATGLLCRPSEIDMDISSLILDLQFLRGHPGATLRPFLEAGAGVRMFSFGEQPGCPNIVQDPSGWGQVCEMANELWTDAGPSLLLAFGFGIQADMGPLVAAVEFQNHFARYTGGVGNAGGNSMNDLNLSFSARLNIF